MVIDKRSNLIHPTNIQMYFNYELRDVIQILYFIFTALFLVIFAKIRKLFITAQLISSVCMDVPHNIKINPLLMKF
jgi:hypothetical protein